MTVGDGAYGADAYFLKENGADVLATNINDDNLKIAAERGFIDKFKAENAEKYRFRAIPSISLFAKPHIIIFLGPQ